MTVIDFRLRPPVGGIKDALLMFNDPAALITMDELLKEMSDLDIQTGVIPARANDRGLTGRFGKISNDDVAGVVARFRNRFCGFYAIDATRVEHELERLSELNLQIFRGIVFEPALCDEPRFIDDPGFDGVYEWCERARLPLMITLGGLAGPDLEHSNPTRLDRVAGRFERTTFVIAHACWPWIDQAIGVAYRRANVYLSPDLFLFEAGGARFIDAVNGFLGERFVFASRFPAMTLKDTLDSYYALGIRDAALGKTLYENAARLLGIEQRAQTC